MYFSLTFSCDSDERQENESNRRRHEGKEENSDEQGKFWFIFYTRLRWTWKMVCFGDPGRLIIFDYGYACFMSWSRPSGWSFFSLFFILFLKFFWLVCFCFVFFLPFSALFSGRSIKTGKADTLQAQWQKLSYLPQMTKKMRLSHCVFLGVCVSTCKCSTGRLFCLGVLHLNPVLFFGYAGENKHRLPFCPIHLNNN